jgi:hypothetical protein
VRYLVSYSDGQQDTEYASIQSAATALLAQYPDGVVYDAGGWDQDEDSLDDAYDVRSGIAALVWASEAESINDDGAHAVASIRVVEEDAR